MYRLFGVLELLCEPVQALVEAVAAGGACGLDVLRVRGVSDAVIQSFRAAGWSSGGVRG